MGQADRLQNSAAQQWRQFTATGSIFDYLDYKQGCRAAAGEDVYADSDTGAGASAGQGGGGGQDTDPSYT